MNPGRGQLQLSMLMPPLAIQLEILGRLQTRHSIYGYGYGTYATDTWHLGVGVRWEF